jgi:TPR repeat protein
LALTARGFWRFVAGLLLLDCSTTTAGAGAPADARRAYDAGHFTDAMGIWAELSRQGDAGGAFGIGLLYDLGNGTQENPEAAFYWYKIAADAGMPEAEFNVGAMYDKGRGVARDSASAAMWYARAAARGHHRAQFDIGQLYEQGDGVPRNADVAAAWLHDAVDGGIAAAGARLKALQAAPQPRPGGPLVAVTPAVPVRNVTLMPSDGNPTVELVWIAPPEPQPVHFQVQVRELSGPASRTVFTATLSETATVIRLPAKSGFYVWSVDAIGRDGSHPPADVSWFSIDPTVSTQQSMTSMRGDGH